MGTLASAIAALENTNPAYNNPGAITDVAPGETGNYFGAGIPIFATAEAGEAAFETKIANIYNGNSSVYSPSMTLSEFGEAYAPNQNYGNSLANILGVPASTQLSSIPSGVGAVGAAGTASVGSTGVLSGAANAIANKFGLPNITGAGTGGVVAGIENWLTSHAEDFVVVIVGLILIAAGVFAFKESQTIISTVAKGTKGAAALAA